MKAESIRGQDKESDGLAEIRLRVAGPGPICVELIETTETTIDGSAFRAFPARVRWVRDGDSRCRLDLRVNGADGKLKEVLWLIFLNGKVKVALGGVLSTFDAPKSFPDKAESILVHEGARALIRWLQKFVTSKGELFVRDNPRPLGIWMREEGGVRVAGYEIASEQKILKVSVVLGAKEEGPVKREIVIPEIDGDTRKSLESIICWGPYVGDVKAIFEEAK